MPGIGGRSPEPCRDREEEEEERWWRRGEISGRWRWPSSCCWRRPSRGGARGGREDGMPGFTVVPARTFRKGEVIFRQDDPMNGEAFLVHKGAVEVRRRVHGEEKLLKVLG